MVGIACIAAWLAVMRIDPVVSAFVALMTWPTWRLQRSYLSAIEEDGRGPSLFPERVIVFVVSALLSAMGVGLAMAAVAFVAILLGF